jgi:hypothetical protein
MSFNVSSKRPAMHPGRWRAGRRCIQRVSFEPAASSVSGCWRPRPGEAPSGGAGMSWRVVTSTWCVPSALLL